MARVKLALQPIDQSSSAFEIQIDDSDRGPIDAGRERAADRQSAACRQRPCTLNRSAPRQQAC
jgi:hypothetical protein